MEFDEVMKFAKQKGFDSVEYKGEYRPCVRNQRSHHKTNLTGFPIFILVSNGMMEYVNTRLGLEILGELLKNDAQVNK